MILMSLRRARAPLALLASAALAGCMVGPNYKRPSAPMSPAFKEAPAPGKAAAGWTTAAPADAIDRGDWWTLFNDATLNGLEQRVRISNQNVAASEAAYRQAKALVAEQRASLFPTLDVNGSANRTGGGGRGGGTVVGGTVVTGGGNGGVNTYRASVDAAWTLDVWGRIRRQVEAARAEADASAADLANATLSAQGELAADYFGLRESDAEVVLDQDTVNDYQRTLQITENQYKAGIVAHTDVMQARTQLDNAVASLQGAQRTRATYEHAIAILVGEAPGNFTIKPLPNWNTAVPDVPAGVPSTLLQRRPDIAAAERRMAEANAQVGVAVAAYFPDLSLSGSYGFTGTEIGQLFNASNALWSVGGSVAETVFDAGLRHAQVRAARAGYDQTVAQYRETVLGALQGVEDNLVATRILAQQYEVRRDASQAADAAAEMTMNQYRAGQVAFTSVVVANAAAFQARIALAQTAGQRQSAAVALIQALGGGWRAEQIAGR